MRLDLPEGWWASATPLSSAISPVQRFALSDRRLKRSVDNSGPCYPGVARQIAPDGVVAILNEVLGVDYRPERFPERPKRFVLPPRRSGEDNSCLGEHATMVSFKQGGRGFSLVLAAGPRASTGSIERLVAAVSGMTIAPRATRPVSSRALTFAVLAARTS